MTIPTIDSLKDQARRLRRTLGETDRPLSHSEALEAVARQHGCRDWNTISALAGKAAPSAPVQAGEAVSGTYLGQPFTGRVLGVHVLPAKDRFRVTLQFDTPVDVVTFDSFSSYRKRVNGVIDASGTTRQKTSDGTPHLQLNL